MESTFDKAQFDRINAEAEKFYAGDDGPSWHTDLERFIRANGGNDQDVELAFEECEGMEIGEAKMSRLDYGMVADPDKVVAEILAEAQKGFKEFVDYMKHDHHLIMSEFDLTDRGTAAYDVEVAMDNLGYMDLGRELQDCLIDRIVDEYLAWLSGDGYRYI